MSRLLPGEKKCDISEAPGGNAPRRSYEGEETGVELEIIEGALSVCRLKSMVEIDLNRDFFFLGRTDGEISLVCREEHAPRETEAREDGWRAFRVKGALDFSLTGILSRLSGVLAEAGIGIFAVSTYNTDYILVKRENLDRALNALAAAGYAVPDRR